MSDALRAEVINFVPRTPTRDVPPVMPVERYAGAFLVGYENPATLRAYRAHLRDWFAWCITHGIDPLGAHRSHFSLWMLDLREGGNGPATINRKMTACTSFYQWLMDEDVVTKNPAKAAKRPKIPVETSRDWLSGVELARFVQAADFEGGYTYALICLLAYNALRINEVVIADVEDLGQVRHNTTLRIMGKGTKPATVVLNGATKWALDEALAGREAGPLILSGRGARVTRDSAGRTCHRIARMARIKGKNITPHSLRHSAITAAHDAGADPRAVQAFARHAKPSTTQLYDHKTPTMDEALSYRLGGYVAERTEA